LSTDGSLTASFLVVLPRPRWHIDLIGVYGKGYPLPASEGAPSEALFRVLVDLHGDVDLVSADRARDVLGRAISARRLGPVVVDLSGVTFMDCRGLSVLVWAHTVLRDRLILSNPSRAVTRLLDLTDLRKVFLIADDEA